MRVEKTPKGPQMIVSRMHAELIKHLFRLEVPEVYDNTVEIKDIVREPSSRIKVAVLSHNPKVDAIGSCVGVKGVRIKSIIQELMGARIDMVSYSKDPAYYIASALSPAKVLQIEIDESKKIANVLVADDQLSLAIGKDGQNVRLAAKLTGWHIDIKSESAKKAAAAAQKEQKMDDFTGLGGVGEKTAEILFNTSFFIYILTLITYSIILINKSKLFKTIGSIMLFTGLLFQTTGLALRWIEAGLSHPPMTNIYESLIFFAWGIVLVYLYFEKKYQINTIGILVIILVLVAMGLASLSPNRNIQPLVPALQSWWLPLHVFFASLSYALFLLSAIFAVLFIIKAQKIKMLIALLFDSFSLFCLLIVGGKSIFLLQPFSLNKVEFADGKIIHSPELISIPGINFLFLILAVFFAFGIIRLISKITTKKTATTKETIDPLSQTISLTCFILYAFSIQFQSAS